jgi:hypothetical protein
MAESHTLSDLRAKYAEFAAELRQIEQRAEQLRVHCEHIAHTILIFDPTAQPQHIQPKTRRQSTPVFRHGEFARIVRDLLRRAGGPMSLHEIADQIAAEHNLDIEASGAKAKLIAKIRPSLSSEHVVKGTGTAFGFGI